MNHISEKHIDYKNKEIYLNPSYTGGFQHCDYIENCDLIYYPENGRILLNGFKREFVFEWSNMNLGLEIHNDITLIENPKVKKVKKRRFIKKFPYIEKYYIDMLEDGCYRLKKRTEFNTLLGSNYSIIGDLNG